MLQGETAPEEICVTILITRAPLLQLHPWLISFSPFKFISIDLYVTKLGQVWKEVSRSVNCFRQWCAENSELCVNRSDCNSFALCLLHLSPASSDALFLCHALACNRQMLLVSMWQVKQGRNKTKRPNRQAGAPLLANAFLSVPTFIHLFVNLVKSCL